MFSLYKTEGDEKGVDILQCAADKLTFYMVWFCFLFRASQMLQQTKAKV